VRRYVGEFDTTYTPAIDYELFEKLTALTDKKLVEKIRDIREDLYKELSKHNIRAGKAELIITNILRMALNGKKVRKETNHHDCSDEL